MMTLCKIQTKEDYPINSFKNCEKYYLIIIVIIKDLHGQTFKKSNLDCNGPTTFKLLVCSLEEMNVLIFAVCDTSLLDLNYGKECLPVQVGQIEIWLDCAFEKPCQNFV